MTACSNCTYQIVSIINDQVNQTLTQVNRIKYLTTIFNRMFGEIANQFTGDLGDLIALIPPPPVFQVQLILDMLTCPLTPLALQIAVFPNDSATALPTSLPDPRRLLMQLIPQLQTYVNQVVQSYEEACNGGSAFASTDNQGLTVASATQNGFANHVILPNNVTLVIAAVEGTFAFGDDGNGHLLLQSPIPAGFSLVSSSINYTTGKWIFTLNLPLTAGGQMTLKYGQPIAAVAVEVYFIKLYRKYIQEVHRVMQDPADFLANYATNLARAQLVKSICPTIYADPTWQFKALDDALVGWSFNGLLPSGIDQRAMESLTILAEGEAKLLAWKTAATIVL